MKRWILGVLILVVAVTVLFLVRKEFFAPSPPAETKKPIPITTTVSPDQLPHIDFVTDESGAILSVPDNFMRAADLFPPPSQE